MSQKPVRTSSSAAGIGLGNVIAVVVSWSVNKSVLWALVHGAFGWLYLLYRLGGCGGPK